MPITREFAYEYEDQAGFMGLRPVWMENADPTTGRGAAHDMLEHFASQEAPLESEFQAVGALYLLRHECGSHPLHGSSIAKSLSNVVASVLLEACQSASLALPRAKKLRRLTDLPVEVITEAVDLAYATLLSRLGEASDEQVENPRPVEEVLACRENVIAWMLFGYRRAVQRYAEADPYTVGGRLFSRIAKAVDELLECQSLIPGALVRISAHPSDGHRVNVRVRQPGSLTWKSSEYFH